MTDTKNILLAGVGGQGTILAGTLLGSVLLRTGFDVKTSEVHGMAQRGGSVITQIRFGPQVQSPIMAPGEADFLLAFEPLEALRWAHYLRPQGVLISDTSRIAPPAVNLGTQAYPNVEAALASRRPTWVPAVEKAKELGNWRAANVLLLGLLSRYFDFPEAVWLQALKDNIRPKQLEINLAAFAYGRAQAVAAEL